jgi:hypothetical protein
MQGLQIIGERQAKNKQKQLSLHNARLQKLQIVRNLSQTGEATAQRNFELARQTLVAKGKVQNSPLGNRSVRAIARAIGFENSQDQAVLARNFDIAREEARNKLMGVDITHYNNLLQIGDTSDRGLTMQMVGISAEGIGKSIGAGGTYSGPKETGTINISRVGTDKDAVGSNNDYNFSSTYGNLGIA